MLRLITRAGVAIVVGLFAAPALPCAAATHAPVLVDQTGKPFTFKSLAGKPLIVDFVAAHCTDACPLINAQFAQAERAFKAQRLNVHLLTITLDPENDPPPVMRRLAQTFSADPKSWTVASGSIGDVHRVMRAFGVVATRGRKGYADVHSTFIYFLDARGNLRKTVLASTDLSTQLVANVREQWGELAR